MIDAETQRLNRFVTNLLDMARVQAGGLNLTIEAVDLTDAVASAVHDARHALTGHAIELDVPPICRWSAPIRCCSIMCCST